MPTNSKFKFCDSDELDDLYNKKKIKSKTYGVVHCMMFFLNISTYRHTLHRIALQFFVTNGSIFIFIYRKVDTHTHTYHCQSLRNFPFNKIHHTYFKKQFIEIKQ